MAGIVLVQLNDSPSGTIKATSQGRALLDEGGHPPAAMALIMPPPPPPPVAARSFALGLIAVLIAALSSAFASVYFERLLKGTSKEGASKEGVGGKEPPGSPTRAAASSLWHKNMQLCAWTVPSNLLLAVLQSSATEDGALAVLWAPTRGFEWSTWG